MANLSNINNKFLVTTGGNVLIGQTGAIGSSLLQVNGIIGVGSSNQTTLNQTSTHFFMDMTSSTSYFRNTSTAGSGFIFRNSNIGDFEFDNEFAGNIKFNTSNVERMRIDSSGNVEIGANYTNAKLSVGGNLAILNTKQLNLTGTLDSDLLWYGMRYDNNEVQIYTYYPSDRSITFNTVSGGTGITTQLMKIEAGGNVGIGETSPTRQLHLKRTSGDVRGIMVETTVATSYAEVQVKAASEFRIGTGGSSTTPNGQFYVYDATAGAHRFDIDANGNVGIGTTNPSTKLHIDQPSNDRAGGLYIERNGSSYGLAAFVNSGGYGIIGGGGSYANDVISIDFNNASVGIGTTSPNYGKLQIDTSSGNNLTIRKGTGTPAIAFGGVTNNEATFLIEGNPSANGFKIYNGSGTLASPTWTAGMDFYDGGRLHPYGGVFLGSSNNSNLLDDYEEGTFSTTVTGITATTNTVQGVYTKIGNMCILQIRVTLSGISAGTGNPYVPLPFTPSGASQIGTSKNGAVPNINTIISGLSYMGIYGNNAQLYANTSSGGYISNTSWSDGELSFTLSYRTV